MHCLRATAIAATLAHVALLCSVLFSSSVTSGAYVSTEIHSRLYFSVGLTCLVLTEAVLGAAYVFASPGAHTPAKTACAVALASAAAGWAALSAYKESTVEHTAGAAVYIAATSLYSLLFIIDSSHCRWVLVTMWVASTVTAITFASLHFTENYAEAAAAEWAAFLAYALTLCAFFSANPEPSVGKPMPTVRMPESARPLLPVQGMNPPHP